jgi:hypothetical protein
MLATVFLFVHRLLRVLMDDLQRLEAYDGDEAWTWSALNDRVYYDERGNLTSDPGQAAF